MASKSDLLQGTLDLLILRTLSEGPMHGWGISQRIQQVSKDVLQVNQGSLYPALHRLEQQGLIDKVKASRLSEASAEEQLVVFLAQHVPAKTSPMCGNSICQDRRFLARHMPRLEAYFHYRNLDVSTLKELAKRWKPDVAKGLSKQGKHEALADIYESIEELKYYRKAVMTI